jgi:hypothetical protein
MILPHKHLHLDRALVGVGAEILAQLYEARTVSELWERVTTARARSPGIAAISFDWFILALCFLYACDALNFDGQLISASKA